MEVFIHAWKYHISLVPWIRITCISCDIMTFPKNIQIITILLLFVISHTLISPDDLKHSTYSYFSIFFEILINLKSWLYPSLESLNFNLNVIIPPYCMWIMWWGSIHPVGRDRFAPINTDKLNIFCFNPLIIKFGVCIVCIEHSVSDLEHLSQLILHDDKNSKYYIINLVIQLWLTFISLQSIQTLSKLHHIDQHMSYLIWNKVFFAIYLENFVKTFIS